MFLPSSEVQAAVCGGTARKLKIKDIHSISVLQWRGKAQRGKYRVYYPDRFKVSTREGAFTCSDITPFPRRLVVRMAGGRKHVFYMYFYVKRNTENYIVKKAVARTITTCTFHHKSELNALSEKVKEYMKILDKTLDKER